jgi:integrase
VIRYRVDVVLSLNASENGEPDQPIDACLIPSPQLREVMDRLGHSTTMAAVRYQHVMADRDAAIARELNRQIEGG